MGQYCLSFKTTSLGDPLAGSTLRFDHFTLRMFRVFIEKSCAGTTILFICDNTHTDGQK